MGQGNPPPLPMGFKPKEPAPELPKGYSVVDQPVKKKESIGDPGQAPAPKPAQSSPPSVVPPSPQQKTDSGGTTDSRKPETIFGEFEVGEPESGTVITGLLGKAIKPLAIPKTQRKKIEDFNIEFEETTGRKPFTLGSDLPQIAKQREVAKYQEYRKSDDAIKGILGKVNAGDATLKDFFDLKKEAPKVFQNVKNQVGIKEPENEFIEDPIKEDAYVSRVFNEYQNKALDQKIDLAKDRRQAANGLLETTLVDAGEFTNKEYKMPTSLQEATAYVNDIRQKISELTTQAQFDINSVAGYQKKMKELTPVI